MIDPAQISGLGSYTTETQESPDAKPRTLFKKGDKVFLVQNPHTIELRCDSKLSSLLQEEYESVMQSRYFGKGGIEIVLANQLKTDEVSDLIRLSYDLTQ